MRWCDVDSAITNSSPGPVELGVPLARRDADVRPEPLDHRPEPEPQRQQLLLVREELVDPGLEVGWHLSPFMPLWMTTETPSAPE